jgi:hypothetical protein
MYDRLSKFKVGMLNPRVLDIQELEKVLAFEEKRLKASNLSEEQKMFASWHAPWRREALEYYLPKGWCFGVWNEQDELVAYFLAQPFIFFQGYTQTLWVEHLAFDTDEQLNLLIDLARRNSRDKHLQKLLIKADGVNLLPQGAALIEKKYFEFTTTKLGTT